MVSARNTPAALAEDPVEAWPLGCHELPATGDGTLDAVQPGWEPPPGPPAPQAVLAGIRGWAARCLRAVRGAGTPRARSVPGRRRAVRRLLTALAVAALLTAGVRGAAGLVSAPVTAPVVQLTSAQAAQADTVRTRAGVVPVIQAGRVAHASSWAEPAISPEALARVLLAVDRAGYATVPASRAAADPAAGQTVLAVSAERETVALVDAILARYGGHAIAITSPATGADALTLDALGLDAGQQHRWSLAPALPAALGSEVTAEWLRLTPQTTPEEVLTRLARLH